MHLKTAVIYGSTRRERQGIKAARFVVKKLEERQHDVSLVDAVEYELPMLDLMFKEYEAGQAPASMQEIADILDAADGFVIVSGEYNHSVPPALKNLLDHFQSEYLYKPSAIVTYSAGPFAGVRALVNMRGIMAELGSPAIPSAFPVSRIGQAFADDGTALDAAYENRVAKFLDEYEWYASALKARRAGGPCSADAPTQQQLCHAASRKG